MNKEFVSYEQALALKELGFNEPCITSYNESGKLFKVWEDEQVIGITKCLAPLYQQAFRWFRDKHGLGHMINGIEYETFIMNIGGVTHVFNPFEFNSYEEAEQACLDKLIEICKR